MFKEGYIGEINQDALKIDKESLEERKDLKDLLKILDFELEEKEIQRLSEGNKEEILSFIKEGQNKESQENRLKALLIDNSSGNILEIWKMVENDSKIMDSLINCFLEIAKKTKEFSQEITYIYEKLPFEKKPSEDELNCILMEKADSFLGEAGGKLNELDNEEMSKTFLEIENRYIRQLNIRKKLLKEMGLIGEELNTIYENLFTGKIEKLQKEELGEYNEWLDNEKRRMGILYKENSDDDEAMSEEDFNFLYGIGENDEEGVISKKQNFDSNTIKRELESLERKYAKDILYKFAMENLDEGVKENIERNRLENEKKYSPIVEKLKKLFTHQLRFERKFEELIYGKESADLPNNFLVDLEKDIMGFKPELKSEPEKNFYLPVGVSSELPHKGEIHAKPIDSLLYMFWLENQGQEVDWVVCDTIQESNYLAFNKELTPNEARSAALENGKQDKDWYTGIKDVFRLDNIKMVDFEELEKDTRYKDYLELIRKLEIENPIFKKAFDSLIQERAMLHNYFFNKQSSCI